MRAAVAVDADGDPRRALVSHCFSAQARFTDEVGYIYSRYKRAGSDEMDESYFPILWSEDGRRSRFIDPFVSGTLPWHAAG